MDHKKFAIQIAVLLAVIFGGMYLSANPSSLGGIVPSGTSSAPTTSSQIKVGNSIVKIEIADTPDERSKGLGGRESLASDSGMLFVFPESKKLQFWMKGMKFPLDFIFINDSKVVDIINNVPPPGLDQGDQTLPIYQPVVLANMMLEVRAGFAQSQGIKVGDSVYLIQQ